MHLVLESSHLQPDSGVVRVRPKMLLEALVASLNVCIVAFAILVFVFHVLFRQAAAVAARRTVVGFLSWTVDLSRFLKCRRDRSRLQWQEVSLQIDSWRIRPACIGGGNEPQLLSVTIGQQPERLAVAESRCLQSTIMPLQVSFAPVVVIAVMRPRSPMIDLRGRR